MSLRPLKKQRFNALAGYARHPEITLIFEEISWHTTYDEKIIGILLFDKIDSDYGWVIFGKDLDGKYRAVEVNVSYSTAIEAQSALFKSMNIAQNAPKESFYQGDELGVTVNFFKQLVEEKRMNASFKILLEDERYSPAKEIISAMMYYHKDIDGNFIQNFQTKGFDARLWELYLWATFTELAYAKDQSLQVPDFIFKSVIGEFAIEATSVNPSDEGEIAIPKLESETVQYLENYIPIRLAGALKRKLNHKPPYWENDRIANIPFCLAVQDFHRIGSMKAVVHAATEYVFGVRHIMKNGVRKINQIGMHRYGKKKTKSGFFKLPNANKISAILINPQGTLTKFNRMGFISGFGNPNVKMFRSGHIRNDKNTDAPEPKYFEQKLDSNYSETWIEGMVVLHNPTALIPLNPNLIPGAAHEFIHDDGKIFSLLPDFHPLYSETKISLTKG